MNTDPTRPAPRTHRRTAAGEAHKAALQAWIDALLADMNDLAARLGVTGPDIVLRFQGHVPADFDAEDYPSLDCADCCPEIYDTLAHLVISNGTQAALIDATVGVDVWAEAVDLWSATREALSTRWCDAAGPGLVVDLTAASAGVWGPLYCPDSAPVPDWVVSLAPAGDPFEALLRNEADELDAAEERIGALLQRYELTAPTAPAHEPGECL